MVKIFDLHNDIGYDMYIRSQQGVKNPFELHREKLLAGGIYYTAIACFFRGDESWEQMQKEILYVENELKTNANVAMIFGCGHPTNVDTVLAFITVEGMGAITEDVSNRIQWLFDHGVRMASLTWNPENALATGVNGNVCRGITDLGIEALNKMNELKMILDVSHLNEMSFWDAIRLFPGKIVASHSNARVLCSNERNLTDQQIKAIACRGGLIGVNAIRKFVSCNPDKQTVHQMALHAKHIKDIAGIQAVAIGFDYLDYYDDVKNAMVEGLTDASQSQNFIKALEEVGFNPQEVNQIARTNVINFIHRPSS